MHLVMFAMVGILLTLVTHAAVRNLTLPMGLWIGFVVAFCFFAGVTYALAVAVMGWYFVSRHPQLRESGLSLGDEVEPPPHPDGRRA